MAVLLLLSLTAPASEVHAAETDETADTTYTVSLARGMIDVVSEIYMRNNKPPKTETYQCLQYRTEPYQSYESYQTYDYLYSIWHPGYWWYGWYYPGYYEPIYGWRTHWHYVTRYRKVSYWDTCSKTTRYYTGGFEGSIPADATNLSATVNGARATISTLKKSTIGGRLLRDIRVNSPKLWYGQSRRVRLAYSLPARPARSESSVRMNTAFLNFCGLAYGRTGGTVTVVIPREYQVSVPAGWTTTQVAGNNVYKHSKSANLYELLECISGTNVSGFTKKTVVSASGQQIHVMAWPDDSEWLNSVQSFSVQYLDSLEAFTGLEFASSGSPIQVREAATTELGPFSGLYSTETGVISVSEDYDKETVVHELTHVWFNENLPRWLAEGLSQWISKRVIIGDIEAPFGSMPQSEQCFVFDPAKRFPKRTISLSEFGENSLLVETPLEVIGAQYVLSCGAVAEFLENLSDAERMRLFATLAEKDLSNAFGADLGVATELSLRDVADVVATSLDPEHSAQIDAWLTLIKFGTLVGLAPDDALRAPGRKTAIEEFNVLQSRLRAIGWDGLDAPKNIRKQLADGEYTDLSALRQISNALVDPIPFFTQDELRASEFRAKVRGSEPFEALSPPEVIEVIRSSGAELAKVGRDWSSGATPVHVLGTLLLGNPDSHIQAVIDALKSGDLDSLRDRSGQAERAMSLSGIMGLLMIAIVVLGLTFTYRVKRGLVVVPVSVQVRFGKIERAVQVRFGKIEQSVSRQLRRLRIQTDSAVARVEGKWQRLRRRR